jgi:outer membrane protein OmpA-like peptidoglycan-associated protein
MEFIMKNNIKIAIALMGFSVIAGCAAPKNASLTEAHNSYNNAAINPQVTTLAALELKDADNTLRKADNALKNRESTESVNHLSYLAMQKISLAQEAAKRKTAEIAVTNATENRNKIQLQARTAEADAANQNAANVQQTADQQALALAAASAQSSRDQDIIAQQEMQLKELNAKKTKRGLVVTLGDVLFNTNKAQLKPGGSRSVQKLADFLKKYPQQKVLIEGYTDSRGSDNLNQKLSERRAETVSDTLNRMGISKERIDTQGYGEKYPIAANDTAANRQMNRRVEIILSDESGNISKR